MRPHLIINGLICLGSVFLVATASAQQGSRIIEGSGGITCRTVVVPGSGEGMREVCQRSVQKCRTAVVPGSGRGPQEVCEQVVQTCRTATVPGSGRGAEQICE